MADPVPDPVAGSCRPGTSRTSSSAHGLGGSPLDSDRKITAATSCMTSTPTAIRPYSAVVSERSSSTLTTNTVDENDSANPTSASAPNDSPAMKPNPITASRPRKPSAIATLIPRCTTRGEPDLAAQQRADVELEPDGEQQQDDPEVRDRLEVRQLGCTHGAEGETRREEADQGRQAQQHREEPAEQRGAEVQGRCCHEVPLAGAVVRSPSCLVVDGQQPRQAWRRTGDRPDAEAAGGIGPGCASTARGERPGGSARASVVDSPARCHLGVR